MGGYFLFGHPINKDRAFLCLYMNVLPSYTLSSQVAKALTVNDRTYASKYQYMITVNTETVIAVFKIAKTSRRQHAKDASLMTVQDRVRAHETLLCKS